MNNLKRIMDERGIGVRELARELGTSAQAPSEWWRGRHMPKGLQRRALESHFGLPVEYLMAEADADQPQAA